ncbi:CK1/CK1 protein kinase [Coprinopsis marcescibilis]|uniref:CK1/CK1 protein kinase n=1 Tax=Coprinopsis marcescibilis TaxID=230819 RepID=A0A5C3L5H6_COPMA|nr:CK1/CK1 protein kinase [Coprinopsis marcescibilis]
MTSQSGSDSDSFSSDYSEVDSDSSSGSKKPQIPKVIANYMLETTLGSGYSGSIFRARHIHNGNVVALKIQDVDHECPTNRFERYLYPLLQGGKGMPTLYSAGVQGPWDFLVIDLLGPSLDNLYRKSGKDVMDIGSVCSIAMQLISRLECMHNRGVLHRDIQLGNCVVGLPPNEKTIYMIDFGFSKRYIDENGRHIPDSRERRDFIGNYWFSSVNVHCRGRVPSRRDDLEAAALMFIHLLTPRGLSWTRNGVPKTSQAHDLLIEEKRRARPEDLCRGLPVEFEDFLRYTRKLKFDQKPDYETWVQVFQDLATEHGYSGHEDLIWPPEPPVVRVQLSSGKHLLIRDAAPTSIPPRDEMHDILAKLTNLNLQAFARPVLADRTNAARNMNIVAPVSKEKSFGKPLAPPPISIGSETTQTSDNSLPQRRSKGRLIADLTTKLSATTNTTELAGLVKEFSQALRLNSSRTLVKEASNFLEVLQNQLNGSSLPTMAGRTRSFNEQPREPARAKLGVVARLRYDVSTARNSKVLAGYISDFVQVTHRSVGRNITKDGFAFLDGLASRLVALPQ